MTASIDLYFSFRSPYSYLAAQCALAIPEEFDAQVNLRPVLPLAIRQPDFFNPENLKRAMYIMIDWERRAEQLGLPHKWPSPDPIVQDFETATIASEQPYIHRLTKLGVLAEREGKGLAMAAKVSRIIFSGTEGWDQGDILANAMQELGLDLAAMEASIAADNELEQVIADNQAQLEASGHWGVPTFVYNNAPYFGQDRIDTLCWQLERDGFKR